MLVAIKEGRNKARFNIFKNQEMEFGLIRSLAAMSEEGAEIGECLNVISDTKDGSLKSFSAAWNNAAFNVESEGIRQLGLGNGSSAKSCFLRASNYYRSAMTCLFPKDKDHYKNWIKAKECFEKAGSLFNSPFEFIEIPFEEGFLPCYFLQPKNNEIKRPTLIVVTGGEGTAMEMYFWCAPEGLRRGYNILLCELPGNISTMYLSSELTLRHDTEIPIKHVIDYLNERSHVNSDKIAIIGYSAGGYFASRAAAFEKRISALIPDSPLRDMHGMFTAVFPKILLSKKKSWLLEFIIRHFTDASNRALIDLILWEAGIEKFSDFLELVKKANLIGMEKNITCPTLVLASEGEGEAFLTQSKLFYNNITSKKKKIKIFTKKEGASAHCQIDNFTLARKTIYDWLDEIFK